MNTPQVKKIMENKHKIKQDSGLSAAAPEQIALENRIALEIREAVNVEREACAKLAQQLSTDTDLYPYPDACGLRIFKAIRRRKAV